MGQGGQRQPGSDPHGAKLALRWAARNDRWATGSRSGESLGASVMSYPVNSDQAEQRPSKPIQQNYWFESALSAFHRSDRSSNSWRKVMMHRLFHNFAIAAGLAWIAIPKPPEVLRGEPLMAELKKGGYTIVLRHARTDRSYQEDIVNI